MPKTILTVDDSLSIRQTVRLTLSSAGYLVSEAASGKAALAACATTTFDVVVTDLNMPEMDGIELIGRLRALAPYKFVPILMLTTDSQLEKKQQGKAAGATGWIVKPFTPDQLVAVIKKVCPS
jgi:two-component system, chemotaxis family, chemotaxis protein CheY